MTSFVVETYVPTGSRERFATDVNGLRHAADTTLAGRVRHIRSYLVPGDEMGFHLVEASTATDVELAARQAGIDAERIVVAVGVTGGHETGVSIAVPDESTMRPDRPSLEEGPS